MPAFLPDAEGAGGHEGLPQDLGEGGVAGRGVNQQLPVQGEHDGPVIGVQKNADHVPHLPLLPVGVLHPGEALLLGGSVVGPGGLVPTWWARLCLFLMRND